MAKRPKHKYVAVVVIETERRVLKKEVAATIREGLRHAPCPPTDTLSSLTPLIKSVRVRAVDFD
jgi:hypothetical protein